jgi:hypothetical protein
LRTTASPPIVDSYKWGEFLGNGNYVTWKNVNIKTCLGELYNKYDKYNLKLTALQFRFNSSANISDAQVSVYISGLPLSSDSCYNTRLGPTNQSCIGALDFTTTLVSGTGAGKTVSFTAGLVSLDKPLQDGIDITIELKIVLHYYKIL